MRALPGVVNRLLAVVSACEGARLGSAQPERAMRTQAKREAGIFMRGVLAPNENSAHFLGLLSREIPIFSVSNAAWLTWGESDKRRSHGRIVPNYPAFGKRNCWNRERPRYDSLNSPAHSCPSITFPPPS